MKEYESPTAELVRFVNENVLSTDSGSCKCILEDQAVNDYHQTPPPDVDPFTWEPTCYIDTAGADEFGLHGKVT